MTVSLIQYSHIVRYCDIGKANWVQDVLCARDPDRWTTVADEGAKALCRACPRRWQCAQDACETPGAEGVWAGVLIPRAGRGRRFALKQLRSLAEHNGFPVRKRDGAA
jgi:WhiB family transcriptional regulator, redox-sensing transcriptional regulator